MFAAFVLAFCRIAIGLLFAVSAAGKSRDVRTFQESVADFRLLPSAWSKAAAWAFLVAEFAVVLLMAIGGRGLLAGFLLAAGLLAAFSVALVVALRRNPGTSCNCFGRSERRISPYDVARNALLLLCAALGAWALAEPVRGLPATGIVLAGLMAMCFALLATNVKDVVETLRHPFTTME